MTVAAMTGMSSNPTGYTASNCGSMIEGDSFSDDSVSLLVGDTSSSPATPVSSMLMAHPDDLVLLTVPHLYWHCCASGPDNEFPVMLNALIDHGADTIFISEQFALSLDLKRQKLFETMSVEMAMPNKGEKQIVNMSEWVKLSLYDLSGGWASKSICAVVAPSLCALANSYSCGLLVDSRWSPPELVLPQL